MRHSIYSLTTFLIIIIGVFQPATASIHNYDIIDEQGNTYSLDIYNDQILIIEAFSTDCSHCIDFHPTLQKLYENYGNRLEMISISVNPDDTKTSLAKFKAEHPTDWIIGLDQVDTLRSDYNVPGTPTTMIFDTSGLLDVCIVGAVQEKEFFDLIDQYINGSNFSYNVENNRCKDIPLIQKLLSSFWFPLTIITIIYIIILYVQKRISKK